jgi:hypothetical protein
MTDDSTLARIVSERPRRQTVDLEWPVLFEGREYRSITLIRLTAGDVSRFQDEIERLLRSNSDTKVRLPLFRDEDGALIPDAVMDALDDDDRLALDEAAANFLPRRFRGLAAQDSGPGIGDTTEASS